MRIVLGCVCSVLALIVTTPAFAQDTDPPPPVTINGTVAVTSDYRFRGISQSDKNAAIQGSITLTHESGFYASVWGSSVSGYVTAATGPAGCCTASVELDLIAGFKKTFESGTTVDVGVLYYVYPKSKAVGDLTSSDFVEPYLVISQTFGPVTAKGLIAYAPKQKALALNQIGPKLDNVYLSGDLSFAIPQTPIGLTAHLGHSIGPSWLATTGRGNNYTDWSLGATATYKMLTLGVSYVDTNANFPTPSGKDAAKGGVVVSLTAAF